MNAAKLQILERGLNGVERKVFHVVPIQDPWTVTQIMTELGRTGTAPNKSVVDWALHALKDQRLIREVQPNLWVRAIPRPKLAAVSSEEQIVPATKPVQLVDQQSPVDKLGDAASALRKLSAQLASLAEDIDEAALEMESKTQSSNAEHEKLKQLAAVLKSLTQ